MKWKERLLTQVEFGFGNEGGTILAMSKATQTRLPEDFNMSTILEKPALKGMALVIGVTTCAASALYLGSGDVTFTNCRKAPNSDTWDATFDQYEGTYWASPDGVRHVVSYDLKQIKLKKKKKWGLR